MPNKPSTRLPDDEAARVRADSRPAGAHKGFEEWTADAAKKTKEQNRLADAAKQRQYAQATESLKTPTASTPKLPISKPPETYPTPEVKAIYKRINDEYDATKAAINKRVLESGKAAARAINNYHLNMNVESHVAKLLAERAKGAATKAAPAIKAVSASAAKAAASPAGRLVGRGLGLAAKRVLPPVGVAMDVAATTQAGYEGSKAYSAHQETTQTARSLRKRGIEVETPSFNPLKAGFPSIFGEHPETKVKEKDWTETAARKKGKLGS